MKGGGGPVDGGWWAKYRAGTGEEGSEMQRVGGQCGGDILSGPLYSGSLLTYTWGSGLSYGWNSQTDSFAAFNTQTYV